MIKLDSDCEAVFFVSTSGRCNIDCDYCIVGPLTTDELSLTRHDLDFLLDFFGVKAFFAFSGKGDFFAGYQKSEKLLSSLLDRNVEVALDINGSIIHEFPDLPPSKLKKVRYINLTMHYQGLKQKGLLHKWAENARLLIEHKGEEMLLGYVISPALHSEWEEGLRFFERGVFEKTGKKILLIRHVTQEFNPSEEKELQALGKRYEHMVEGVFREDFAEQFKNIHEVLCPAGHSYFRIWNDGTVQGCAHIEQLADCGNLKQRKITVHDEPYRCPTPGHCDCHIVDGLGKLVYP